MTEEFDKEIDILLRQAARHGETVSEIAGLHLDADEINAFAEQVLPDKARLRAVSHLADCSRCRNILSNLITFNAENKSEIFPAKETKIISVPWYKRLFVFPQIAYTMGVLALVFSGIIAIFVLKNSTQNNSSEVAQIIEKERSENPVPTGAGANSTASNSANSAMSSASYENSNAASISPSSRNKNISSALSENSMDAAKVTQDKNVEAAKPAPKTVAPADELDSEKKEKTEIVAGAPPSPARENNYTVDGTANDSVTARRQAEPPLTSQNSTAQNQIANQASITPDTRSVQSLPMNGRSTKSLQMTNKRAEPAAGNAAEKDDDSRANETRAVGGKNFRRADGVWYDIKYKGGKTVNISRGSADYKKLDDRLRSIADKLGGVTVIFWKDKAYRIQ